MARLRSHGMVRTQDMEPWFYEMPELGYSHRASDIHGALGVPQMKKLDRFIEKRRELASLHTSRLEPLAPVITPPKRLNSCNPAWHLYVVQLDFERMGADRSTLMKALLEKNIGTQVHHIPVHQQPCYRNRYGDLDLPGAQHYNRRTLSLPLFPEMEEKDVNFVVDTLAEIAGVTA